MGGSRRDSEDSFRSDQSAWNEDKEENKNAKKPIFLTTLLGDDPSVLQETKDKLDLYINKIDTYYELVYTKHDRDFINAYKVF